MDNLFRPTFWISQCCISPDTSLVMTDEIADYSYEQYGSLLVILTAHHHARFACRDAHYPKRVLHAWFTDELPIGSNLIEART